MNVKFIIVFDNVCVLAGLHEAREDVKLISLLLICKKLAVANEGFAILDFFRDNVFPS